jgi:hypothetical protein
MQRPVDIRVQLPLPLPVFAGLLEAVGDRWPGALLVESTTDHAVLRVDSALDPDPDETTDDTTDADVDPAETAAVDAEVSVLAASGPNVALGLPTDVAVWFVDMFAELLDGHDAPNYVEVSVRDPRSDASYSVTVRRPDGKSPEELRRAAVRRAETAERFAEMLWKGAHISTATSYRNDPDGEQVWVYTMPAWSQDSGEDLDPELVELIERFGPRR